MFGGLLVFFECFVFLCEYWDIFGFVGGVVWVDYDGGGGVILGGEDVV